VPSKKRYDFKLIAKRFNWYLTYLIRIDIPD
jgi:hypothetical protein